ncbi:MAG: HAD-IA family hydrolase [Clostridia bacterium]|nr:HAD-IA family hydrolase [Clostridia bacterium]
MKYKMIIFDLDGTLLNTLDDLAGSLNFALAAEGFGKRTTEEVRSFVGNGIRNLVRRGLPSDVDEETAERVFNEFREHYAAHSNDMTAPYSGVTDMLKELRDRGYILALISNKADFAVQDLCRIYFPGLFHSAAGEKEGVRRKPAPDAILALLEKYGLEPGEVCYVGDSEVDVETAENAGTDLIAVDWGFRNRKDLEARGADVIISSPEEIFSLV